jgi:sugar phosphate isomerase/epimerase
VPLPSLSLQLYSVRNALEADIAGTIDRVAEIGFRQVEASYKVLSRGPELLDAIRRNDLIAPTMTSPLIDVDRDAVFATANELGAKTVIETFIPEQFWTSVDDVATIADELNAAAEKAAGYGLRVAYHNHWWELEQKFDGRTAFDTLTDRLDPSVLLEVDAYWVAVGGENVLEFLGRQADRVHFLHLKDGPVNRENTQQVPAGQGAMPLWDVIEAAPNLEVGVIEFDDYAGDVFEAIAASFAYLNPKVAA